MKMNFGNSVVIEPDGLANGVLGNFESPIQIPTQRGLKMKSERETQRMGFQSLEKLGAMG